MAAKQYVVIVTFPSAPASMAQTEVRLTATDPSVAVNRAIKQAIWQLRRKTKHRGLQEMGRVTWSLIKTEKEQQL